jgi:hypothetical protein
MKIGEKIIAICQGDLEVRCEFFQKMIDLIDGKYLNKSENLTKKQLGLA